MPIRGVYFARKAKENIEVLLFTGKNNPEQIRQEVAKILQQVLVISGTEESTKIIEELNLTYLLQIYPITDDQKKD
jgi:hypothetical protein